MIYKYITEIEKGELQNANVIPCINESGQRTLLFKNSSLKIIEFSYDTKHLIIKKNVVLNYDNKKYYFHLISCKDSTDYMDHNFDIIYEYVFKKIENPIDEDTFSELMFSIQNLFQKPSGDLNNIQIGTAGELITLLYFYNKGYKNILNDYHKNAYSKHDIEITETKKIEVKTTTKANRIHRFTHEQLHNLLYDIFVSSVILYTTEKGTSLFELFVEVLNKTNNFETKFSLHKMMNYCGIDTLNQGIVFSLKNSIRSVKLMNSKDLPQISTTIPQGVTNISYESACDLAKECKILDIINTNK